MKKLGTFLTVATALAVTAAPALAQRKPAGAPQLKANVYVIHGIYGDDLGLPSDLPVDVLVNDALCAITDFRFGEVEGPLALDGAAYNLKIKLASSSGPCAGATVIDQDVTVAAGKTYTVVAHFKADAAGVLTGIGASAFENDVTPTGPGRARIAAHHTALAPAVDIYVGRNLSDPTAPALSIPGVKNGDEPAKAPIQPGQWHVALNPAGAADAALGPLPVNLKPFTAYFVYAIGSVYSESLTLRTIAIGNLK